MKIYSKTTDFDLHYTHRGYPHVHTHSFWEFMIVTEGTYLHHINSASSFLTKNTVQMIRPSDMHSNSAISSQKSIINLVVSSEKLKQQLDLFDTTAYETLLNQKEEIKFTITDEECQAYLQKTLEAQRTKGNELQYRYRILQIFQTLIQDLIYHHFIKLKEEENPSIPEHIQQIITLLNNQEHFHLPITEIAKKTSYSYVHISRSFKKYMNVSISDYYLAIKLNYGRRLLESGVSVASAAEQTGYSSQSHFNTAFKKFYNVSPTQYKKDWSKFNKD